MADLLSEEPSLKSDCPSVKSKWRPQAPYPDSCSRKQNIRDSPAEANWVYIPNSLPQAHSSVFPHREKERLGSEEAAAQSVKKEILRRDLWSRKRHTILHGNSVFIQLMGCHRHVLLRLVSEREQATPGELAEFLGMTRGAVSKVVDKLEAKSWLQARTAAADNRVRLLSLGFSHTAILMGRRSGLAFTISTSGPSRLQPERIIVIILSSLCVDLNFRCRRPTNLSSCVETSNCRDNFARLNRSTTPNKLISSRLCRGSSINRALSGNLGSPKFKATNSESASALT